MVHGKVEKWKSGKVRAAELYNTQWIASGERERTNEREAKNGGSKRRPPPPVGGCTSAQTQYRRSEPSDRSRSTPRGGNRFPIGRPPLRARSSLSLPAASRSLALPLDPTLSLSVRYRSRAGPRTSLSHPRYDTVSRSLSSRRVASCANADLLTRLRCAHLGVAIAPLSLSLSLDRTSSSSTQPFSERIQPAGQTAPVRPIPRLVSSRRVASFAIIAPGSLLSGLVPRLG